VDLPLDLLVIILSFLQNDHRRTARILCKAFRDASNQCVTALSFRSGEGQRAMLNQRLKVFKSVKFLDLTIRRARDVSLLRRPAVLSRLRELRLTCSFRTIIPLLAAAPHLTKLELARVAATQRFDADSRIHSQLFEALSTCPSSLEVTLCVSGSRTDSETFVGIDTTPILRLIGETVFLSQLPDGHVSLAHFTRLKCLELVYVSDDDGIEAIAALTQLTRLVLVLEQSMGSQLLMPLSQLTALQELAVGAFDMRFMREFRLVVAPMVEYRELLLWLEPFVRPPPPNLHLTDVESLLSTLPAVTSLVLETAMSMPQQPPGAFLGNGFAGLRKLSLFFQKGSPADVERLAVALPELEALPFVGYCDSLLPHLPPMPRLTQLKAAHRECHVILRYVSGNVLARFQSLQQLHLHGVLDTKQWGEDVKSLAVLTGLRVLNIRSCDPYFVSLWHVTMEELMPLTALKQLRNFDLCSVSASESDVTEFWEAMKAVRHEMGFSCSVVPSFEDYTSKFVF
jgi:hypothetical protein